MTSKRLLQAKEEHGKWLEKHRLTPVHIKSRKLKKDRKEFMASYRGGLKPAEYVSHEMTGAPCYSKSIWNNLHKEPDHVREEIVKKATRCSPQFNKGGYQYSGDVAPPKGGKEP